MCQLTDSLAKMTDEEFNVFIFGLYRRRFGDVRSLLTMVTYVNPITNSIDQVAQFHDAKNR